MELMLDWSKLDPNSLRYDQKMLVLRAHRFYHQDINAPVVKVWHELQSSFAQMLANRYRILARLAPSKNYDS